MKETIIFCLPGTTYSWKFLKSWTTMFQWCLSEGITVITSQATSANIFEVRNKCLGGQNNLGHNQKPFQEKIQYDYIFMLDSDQVWKLKDFQKMLNTMRSNPIIQALTGVYCRVTDTEEKYSTIMKIDKSDILSLSYRLLSIDEVNDLPKLSKVAAAGLGFCMFRYGVFEKLEFPWYRPIEIIDKKLNKVVQYTAEDLSIFVRLKEVGVTLWCDNTVRVGHEKMRVFRGEI